MSEKYVKDIMEKLDEIEKLHAKLRSLVPRMKNYKSENTERFFEKDLHKQIPVDIRRTSETFKNLCESSKTNIKQLGSVLRRDSKVLSTKYLNRSKWRELRKNSMGFVTRHWHDKGGRIKDLLSNVIERDIILVNRAAQTLDNEIIGTNVTSTKEQERIESSSRTNQAPPKRRRTLEDQLERLLEHFNYSRDPETVNGNRVSTHRHSSGEDEPRRVRRTPLLSDEKSETLKIISSAQRVSINDNHKVK